MSVFRELQARHENLLVKQELGDDILAEAQQYIDQVRKESAQISSVDERETLRANLRYWSSYIYEQTDTYPNTELIRALRPVSEASNWKKWLLFVSLVVILMFIILYFFRNSTQRADIIQLGETISSMVDQSLEEPSELVFAGQVNDDNGRWLNDFVIVLFRNGEEIARTTSRLLNSPLSSIGPADGIFELRVPNEYKLTLAQEFYYSNGNLATTQLVPSIVGTRDLGIWIGQLRTNSLQAITIPVEQQEYAIVVLAYTEDSLPESYSPGNLSLNGGVLMTNLADSVGGENVAVLATAVPNLQPVPQSVIQFTVLPSLNNGLDWHLQMTGYYGNRRDVWERFIAGRVPGMDWETFKESVLVHNPHLEEDNFVFYPDKGYLLPMNQ